MYFTYFVHVFFPIIRYPLCRLVSEQVYTQFFAHITTNTCVSVYFTHRVILHTRCVHVLHVYITMLSSISVCVDCHDFCAAEIRTHLLFPLLFTWHIAMPLITQLSDLYICLWRKNIHNYIIQNIPKVGWW